MKMEQALSDYLVGRGVADRGGRPEDWYAGGWFRIRVFGTEVPFVPVMGFRTGLPAHDAHHMLTGYDTSWKGEMEVAAWELASGGCGRHPAYWIDRLLFSVIAVVLAPIRTIHAFRRGLGGRNLYSLDTERLLATEFDEVRHWVDPGM